MSNEQSNIANWASTVKTGISSAIKELHTALPGIIVTFDATTQTAEVKCAIRRVFRTDADGEDVFEEKEIPVLINVPVQFPRGGGYSLTFPVAPGDECLIVFCERAIDNWREFGGVRSPAGKRFHSYSDATAFVGLSSKPNTVPDYDTDAVALKKDDGSAVIKVKAGEIELTTTNVVINATQTTINGNVDTYGQLRNNDVNVGSTHYHQQGPDSNGDTEQDTGGPQ